MALYRVYCHTATIIMHSLPNGIISGLLPHGNNNNALFSPRTRMVHYCYSGSKGVTDGDLGTFTLREGQKEEKRLKSWCGSGWGTPQSEGVRPPSIRHGNREESRE